MNNPLIVDVETSSVHPFDPNSKLLFVGTFDGDNNNIEEFEFSPRPYSDALGRVSSSIESASIMVGFAVKFDLHWLKRYGINLENKKILCLQVAEYILSGQTVRMPSLDDCLAKRGLPPKLPFDFGVEHSEASWREYLAQDLLTEWLLYQAVLKDLENQPKLKRLIFDSSQDLLITQQMEGNGIKYDFTKSKTVANRIYGEIAELDYRLQELVPYTWLNWASGDHLSAVLFGGIAKYIVRESYERTLKNGEIRHKEHWVDKEYVFPRLVEPLEKIKKEGYFKTDEGTLRSLKNPSKLAQEIINLILERSKLDKKVGTYYNGIPKLYEEMRWEDNLLHGQLHHCVTKTGRLSSSTPNLQNIEDGVRECLVSRFKEIN